MNNRTSQAEICTAVFPRQGIDRIRAKFAEFCGFGNGFGNFFLKLDLIRADGSFNFKCRHARILTDGCFGIACQIRIDGHRLQCKSRLCTGSFTIDGPLQSAPHIGRKIHGGFDNKFENARLKFR